MSVGAPQLTRAKDLKAVVASSCFKKAFQETDASSTVIKQEIHEPIDYSLSSTTLNEWQDSDAAREHNDSGEAMHAVKCRPFVCMICCRNFAQRSNLKVHLRSHTGEKPFRCDQCDKTFSYSVSLKRHLMTHTGKKPFNCSQCERKFIRSSSLKCHMRTHSGEKPYKCELCQKCFTESGNLKRHTRSHMDAIWDVSVENNDASHFAPIPKQQAEDGISSQGDELFRCTWCDKHFTDLSRLKKHAYHHTREKPCKCEICNKCFISPVKLSNHIRLIHSTEKIHDCDQCDKKFANRRSLKYHRMTHRKRFACEFCGQTFSRSTRWKQHCSLCHADKLYQPATGDDVSESSVRRDAEIKLIYNCELCTRTFTCLRSLGRHRSIHFGENCFTCMLCDKNFSKLSKLRSHLKIHNIEKPYHCKHCEKGFLTPAKLKRHEACHTGEKRYQCSNCDKRFMDSTHLKRHAKTHICDTERNSLTSNNLDNLNMCGNVFLVDSIESSEKLHCLTGEIFMRIQDFDNVCAFKC